MRLRSRRRQRRARDDGSGSHTLVALTRGGSTWRRTTPPTSLHNLLRQLYNETYSLLVVPASTLSYSSNIRRPPVNVGRGFLPFQCITRSAAHCSIPACGRQQLALSLPAAGRPAATIRAARWPMSDGAGLRCRFTRHRRHQGARSSACWEPDAGRMIVRTKTELYF
jgi:hypothetical protein